MKDFKTEPNVKIRNYLAQRLYDAGSLEVTTTETVVEPEFQIDDLLIYPLVNFTVKIGDSEKGIFLPKEIWTPISVTCSKFRITGIAEGTVHWQGWVE